MNNSISQKFTLTSLFRFSLPSILMLILTSLYTSVDGVFVSRFVGSDALSAINILLPLDSIMIGLSIMFGTGGSAIIGFKLGAGQEREAKENFTLITVAAVIIGTITAVLFVLFLPSIIPMLGASRRLFSYCMDYGYILTAFAVPYILQFMFNSLFITAGKPKLALAVTAIAGAMNLILDYLFIAIFDMGIGGAAWGTALSRSFGGLYPVIYFIVNKEGLHFSRPKLDFRVISRTITNGSSEMVSNIAAGVTTFLFNITMMKLLGEEGIAAMTIVLYTQFIYSSVYFGFANSCAPVISYNYGKGDTMHLKKLFRYCLIIIGGSTAAMLALSFFAAQPLITLFTPRGNRHIPTGIPRLSDLYMELFIRRHQCICLIPVFRLLKRRNIRTDLISADIRVHYRITDDPAVLPWSRRPVACRTCSRSAHLLDRSSSNDPVRQTQIRLLINFNHYLPPA